VGYDGIQRPQSTSATEGSSTIWSQARTYDNVGNVLQLATTVPTVGGGTQTDNQSFCYDALSRLIWADNSSTPSGGDHCGNAPSGTTLSTYQQSFSLSGCRSKSGQGFCKGKLHEMPVLHHDSFLFFLDK
jgi:hypothetical protein